jgi:hypothetical protein
LEWLPSRTQTTTNVGKHGEEGTLLVGMQASTTTVKNNMEAS